MIAMLCGERAGSRAVPLTGVRRRQGALRRIATLVLL